MTDEELRAAQRAPHYSVRAQVDPEETPVDGFPRMPRMPWQIPSFMFAAGMVVGAGLMELARKAVSP